ncbi:MAG: sigma-70 family RNA polymerase sigma factor [Pseudomonadota bacterium]
MSRFTGIHVSAALLARARRYEDDATSELCRLFAPPVYTLAARILADRAQADDVVQETLVQMLNGLADFRGEASLATWVRRIAVSRCLMHQRTAWEQRRTGLDTVAELATPGDGIEQRVLLGDALATALEQLSDTARTVVWLHDVEGYTHKEIAALTGRSVSFSKSSLARAHKQLRGELKAEAPPGAAPRAAAPTTTPQVTARLVAEV